MACPASSTLEIAPRTTTYIPKDKWRRWALVEMKSSLPAIKVPLRDGKDR